MIASIVLYLFCCGAAGMNLFVMPQPRGSRVGRRLHSAQIHTYMQHIPIYTAQYNQGICNWELTSDLHCSGSCSKNFVKIIHMNIAACFYNNYVGNYPLIYLHCYTPYSRRYPHSEKFILIYSQWQQKGLNPVLQSVSCSSSIRAANFKTKV
jgi:hypothetical protein